MSTPSKRIDAGGKVYSLSTVGSRVVVATANRQVLVYDLRSMSAPEQTRESPLRHQTRRVACSPNGEFFAISSTEVSCHRASLLAVCWLIKWLILQGRVGIEYFELDAEHQSKKYAFKCHRRGDIAYPINTLAFHPVFGQCTAYSNQETCCHFHLFFLNLSGTFVTGGCDGVVNVWDGVLKKRLSQFAQFPSAVASLAFRYSSSLLFDEISACAMRRLLCYLSACVFNVI